MFNTFDIIYIIAPRSVYDFGTVWYSLIQFDTIWEVYTYLLQFDTIW